MDHETALEAANQALNGGALRPGSRIASVEFRGVDPMRRSGPALRSFDDRPGFYSPSANAQRTSEAWQIAAMFAVGIATLVLVVTLWLL